MVSEAEMRRVGALIRNRRHVLDLSQTVFAGRVGVSRNAVSKWETGLSYPLRHAGKIEAVLGISLAADADLDPNEDVLRSLDLDPQRLGRLVEAYRAIRNGGPRPPRERAG